MELFWTFDPNGKTHYDSDVGAPFDIAAQLASSLDIARMLIVGGADCDVVDVS
jgi:hypothetical protein